MSENAPNEHGVRPDGSLAVYARVTTDFYEKALADKAELARLRTDLEASALLLQTAAQEIERKDAALRLVDQVFARANASPNDDLMGDDEHEAWSAVRRVLLTAKK